MITLTKIASDHIVSVMKDQDLLPENSYLKVGVLGGGCSGYKYSLDITTEKNESDEMWENEGVRVICDSRSHIYLDGTEIDFQDSLNGKGFVFKNPNHTQCGCGSSFS